MPTKKHRNLTNITGISLCLHLQYNDGREGLMYFIKSTCRDFRTPDIDFLLRFYSVYDYDLDYTLVLLVKTRFTIE